MDYRNIPRESRPPKKFFPEYHIWRAIKWRCSLPQWIEKGITLAPEWQDFWSFYEALGPRPTKNCSVDRISNDLGYSPENCRWATPQQQAVNRKTKGGRRGPSRSPVFDLVTGERLPPVSSVAEYVPWIEMKGRCNNPNHLMYYNYGAKGVKVCSEWEYDFWAFRLAVGPRPSKDHSLDRIDPAKNYEPGNVKWATRKEQANNRKYHRRISHNGEDLTSSQWSDRSGVPSQVIYCRHFDYGWPAEKAIWQQPLADERAEINDWASGTKKSQHNRKGMVLGDTDKTLAEHGKEIGIDPETLRKRLKAGETAESAITKKSGKHGIRTDGKTARGGMVLTFRGETKSLAEWSEIVGINYNTLRYRIEDQGMTVEEAFTTPVHESEQFEFNGESRTLMDWSKHLDISYETLRQRMEYGHPFEKVFEKRPPIKADFPQLEPYIVGSVHTVNGRELAVIRWDEQEHTLQDWAKVLDVTIMTIRWRLNKGLPLEKVFAGRERTKKESP